MIVFGIHAVTAKIKAGGVSQLYVGNRESSSLKNIISEAQQRQIKVIKTDRKHLDEMSDHGKHQGIVAMCDARSEQSLSFPDFVASLDNTAFILILDQVQDPHNLGACLRSADCAGVDAVIIPKHKSVSLNSTVHKVACGAADNVPLFQVPNLVQAIERLKEQGVWVYGLDGEAEQSYYEHDFSGAVALVLGAEGKGMRPLTQKHCDGILSIPLHGSVPSLNVSVATGIVLFEVNRQRNQQKKR